MNTTHKYNVSACHPILFEIPVTTNEVLNGNLFINLTQDIRQNISYGLNITSMGYACQWYDITDNQWKTDGCQMLNFTSNHSILCGCYHLTTFRGVGKAFIPQINILEEGHLRGVRNKFCNVIYLFFD